VLSAELDDGFCGAPGGSGIATEYFETALDVVGSDLGRDMTSFDRTRDSLFDQVPRPSDVAERPNCGGKIARRQNTGIRAEAKLGVMIARGIVYPQRQLEMRLRP